VKKYNIEFDGVHYRVVRLYLGFIGVSVKEFLSFENAIEYIKEKVGTTKPPKREWKVVWRGYKKI